MKHLGPAVALVAAVAMGCSHTQSEHSSESTTGWKLPRLADGRPDLQGVWGNNGVTPMTRPRQWKDKATLTDGEVEELKNYLSTLVAVGPTTVQQFLDGKDKGEIQRPTEYFSQLWMADRVFDNRTSLIIDPPNGQFPPLTREGEARRATEATRTRLGTRADGPEDRRLVERCISDGAPRIVANYNSYVQIVQSPKTVVIFQEMIHDARVVPMTAIPHLPPKVRQLHGDPRGRWEGDTLVIETTNYSVGFLGSSQDVKLTERYTRVSPDTIHWRVTVNDAATWTQPWTFMISLIKTDDLIYEYACHEGNRAMEGILAGARAEEAKAMRQNGHREN